MSSNTAFKVCVNQHHYDASRNRVCPFCAVETKPSPEPELSYPVGWLVILDGPMAGQDFTLRAGQNQIGRTQDSEVLLSADASLPESLRTGVIYNPQQNSFMLETGPVSTRVLCNGRPVNGPAMLAAGDRIRVGDTNMAFIPLAGGQFSWS